MHQIVMKAMAGTKAAASHVVLAVAMLLLGLILPLRQALDNLFLTGSIFRKPPRRSWNSCAGSTIM